MGEVNFREAGIIQLFFALTNQLINFSLYLILSFPLSLPLSPPPQLPISPPPVDFFFFQIKCSRNTAQSTTLFISENNLAYTQLVKKGRCQYNMEVEWFVVVFPSTSQLQQLNAKQTKLNIETECLQTALHSLPFGSIWPHALSQKYSLCSTIFIHFALFFHNSAASLLYPLLF